MDVAGIEIAKIYLLGIIWVNVVFKCKSSRIEFVRIDSSPLVNMPNPRLEVLIGSLTPLKKLLNATVERNRSNLSHIHNSV